MGGIGVLASGNGSNLQAILDAPVGRSVCVVIANRAEARALERARAAGVPALLIEHGRFATREDFDRALADALAGHGVETVALAGFMRIVGAPLLSAFPARIVNVHPALLPAFPGLHAQRQAIDAGARVAGCTVHLVDGGVDTGPILAQAALSVAVEDDEATLSRRILTLEHALFPAVLDAIGDGRLVTEPRPTWRGALRLTAAARDAVARVGGIVGAPLERAE